MVTRIQTYVCTLALLTLWGLLALGVYALLLPPAARGDDRSEKVKAALDEAGRPQRVRDALAAGVAARPAAPEPVAVAPMPHAPRPPAVVPQEMPGKKLPYGDAYALALAERKPLVIFVGCEGPAVPPGAVGTTLPQFVGVEKGRAAVTVPHRGGLILDATVDCESGDLRKAVREAAGKVEPVPDAASAPPPLDWQIRRPGVPAARPFGPAPSTTGTTVVRGAVTTPTPAPTFSTAPAPYRGRTYTLAPGAGFGGITGGGCVSGVG